MRLVSVAGYSYLSDRVVFSLGDTVRFSKTAKYKFGGLRLVFIGSNS